MTRAIELLRVGFDLDGILAQTELATLAALKAAGVVPEDANLSQLTTFNWEEAFPSIPKGFMGQLFAKGDVFARAPANTDAFNCLNSLTAFGVETHIVTHRPWDHVKPKTAEWLKRFGAQYGRLVFVNERKDKLRYCHQAGLDVFVEDNLETARELAASVRLSLLYDRTYNRTSGFVHTERRNLVRFYRFPDLVEFFGIRPGHET